MSEDNIVKKWFGIEFFKFSPQLQELHIYGGELEGEATVELGVGVAKLIGRMLADKLNLPAPGIHKLSIHIFHDNNVLHWNRTFNDSVCLSSEFVPVGTIGSGYWLEKNGHKAIELTVDIVDGGWYWRALKFNIHGFSVPRWLFPKLEAYKLMKNDRYHFYVGFSVPLLGKLVSYSGVLTRK